MTGVPSQIAALIATGADVVVSVSGGKDSTATALLLKELGVSCEYVFCDTGWEHAETYRYIREVLEPHIGKIRVLRHDHQWSKTIRLPLLRATTDDADEIRQAETELAEMFTPLMEQAAQEVESILGWRSDFVRMAISETVFPSRNQRWCTRFLKFKPVKAFLQSKENPVNVVGIRREESRARSQAEEVEFADDMDAWVWRPIVSWSLDDVIACHKRHGIPPNPLYLRRATRVGCYPCIFARKEELSGLEDARVHAIEVLERHISWFAAERARRSGKPKPQGGSTMFYESNSDESWPIKKVMEWAKTSYGGRQVQLFAASPADAGCMRWGLCDTNGSGVDSGDGAG